MSAPISTAGAAGLPEELRALLTAVRDALDIPLAEHETDDATRVETLSGRASDARIIIDSVLTARFPCPEMIPDAAEQLRGWIAERPVTYTPWQSSEQDGGAA
jgi:hypothetical protein